MGVSTSKNSSSKVMDNLGQPGPASGDSRPEGIQQAASGLTANIFRQVFPTRFMDEIYNTHYQALFKRSALTESFAGSFRTGFSALDGRARLT
jgi:hypothetical protein